MLPTLNGRIQTRIFMLLTLGVFWTLVLTPILPGDPDYRTTFILLAVVIVLGVLWELVYHGIQQFRWEKDWPTLFGFITWINEFLLIMVLLRLDLVPGVNGPAVSTWGFLILFLFIWMSIWVFTNGPMRVPFIRWRFFGGRLV
jgi:hypothetical protein